MNLTEENFNEINKIANVSRETFAKLDGFIFELIKWNKKINLVSKKHSSFSDVWQRHIVDSAQLIKYFPESTKKIIDFGSGGGFPALVLAIIGGYEIHLIESDSRKCAFLNQIKSLFDLNVHIHNERIENINPFESDVITARALAPLSGLLDLTWGFVQKTKLCIFLKGENVVEEIDEASGSWNFDYSLFCSVSNRGGQIIVIKNVLNAGNK